MPRSRVYVASLLLGCLGMAAWADELADFREQIAPLFERHCVSCHQGDKPKGGLALTQRQSLLGGGDSGPAIEPGKPDDSLLVDYISGEKPEMPKDAPPLSAEQVAAIRRWIAAGARWPDDLVLADKRQIDARWWSLGPLTRPTAPALAAAWIRTPVDAFILSTLNEHQLAPSAEADRRTLIRRLTFDLHGLPPTPEEMRDFQADVRPDAYERLVDRLLASPRYGERWGRFWLDVVHFGESHGYDKDKPRSHAWPYRDYVIRSLNDDTPYDRFVAEQIAGDVLYPENPQATVATGFIAAGPWDFVGHVELRENTVDKDIARSNDRDDMVANAMSTFTSLTVHCARCHNHKFDPIEQEDYYALQAVFAGIERAERPYDITPAIARERLTLTAEKSRLESGIEQVRGQIDAITSPQIVALDASLAGLKKELAALPPAKASTALGYHSQIMAEQDTVKWVQVDLGAARAIDQIVLVPAHVVYGGHSGPGFGFPQRFKVELSDSADFAQSRVVADHTGADFPHPGDTPDAIDTPGATARYVRVTATKLWRRTDDWIFALAELLVLSGRENLAAGQPVSALDSIEAPTSWSSKNLVDGFDSRTEIFPQEPSRRQAIEQELEAVGRSRQALIQELIPADLKRERQQLEQSLVAVNGRIATLPAEEMVYAAANHLTAQGSLTPPRKPRPIFLLARGDVRSPRQAVAPGAVRSVAGPAAKFSFADDSDESQRRAALAHWLSDSRNALVRRSIVNRVWQYHFGQGLVDTPNDFGRMGSLPSHPELLEWLAGWFIDQGHSLKQLHRLLLVSAVYRQSSDHNAEYGKVDATNRYLWRANRQRLDAECVRDSMLAVSGMLDTTMGGPSVRQFFFKDDHSPVYDYERFNVDDPRSLRRSVYRFLVRSVPDPFMECLDCADPSIMTPKRSTTLTSIQALALLNNPFVVRQAEHLARRLQARDAELEGQINAAYALAFGRSPTAQERSALVEYAQKHGLANACRALLNSNEFVFID